MSDFTIIKNAPIIENRGWGRPFVYPFAEMEVGDAFDAPRKGLNQQGAERAQSSISVCARNYALRHNPTAKFTVRLLDEKTVRCWRIA